MEKKILKDINKMRPSEKYSKVLKLRESCGKDFFQHYQHTFVEVICPACGSGGKNELSKYGFNHKKCDSCKTLWCTPRPTEQYLSEYYNNWDAPKCWTELLLETEVDRKVLQYNPRVEEIVRNLVINPGEKIELAVDIGAGSGAFALALEKRDIFARVLALDLSEECVNFCRHHGLEAKVGSVDDLSANTVDLIIMNDLIEHLFDPFDYLTKCQKALKPGGVISIATPNGEGFDFKILKIDTVNLTPPEHLNYFNPGSMKILLESSGFEIISLETPGILDTQIIIREVLMNNFQLSQNNEYLNFLLFESDPMITNNFQKFLIDNKLSSHMLALGRKPRSLAP